jgi:hypothetical protein
MNRTESLGTLFVNFFIKHSVAIFIVATACCLILISYITNYFNPNVIGAWLLVGILTSLLFSGVALVVVLAVAAFEKARHLRVITYEPHLTNVTKEVFERERINIGEFYSPFFISDNKLFKECEIQGPGSIQFIGLNNMNECSFHMCDYIVVKDDDKLNTSAHFTNATFTKCKFVNVALYMPKGMAEKFFENHKAATGEELSIVGLGK